MTKAKEFSKQDLNEIEMMVNDGYLQTEIAKTFNCCTSVMSKVIRKNEFSKYNTNYANKKISISGFCPIGHKINYVYIFKSNNQIYYTCNTCKCAYLKQYFEV